MLSCFVKGYRPDPSKSGYLEIDFVAGDSVQGLTIRCGVLISFEWNFDRFEVLNSCLGSWKT